VVRQLRPLRLLLVAAAAASALAVTPDPYQIFARARDVWASQQYPHAVSYTIAVTVNDHGTIKTNHYRAVFDATEDKVYVNAVSREEREHPYEPKGIDEWLDPKRQFRTLFKRRVGRPEAAVDYLGVPLLAPNYSFGMSPFVPLVASSKPDQAALVEQIRRAFHDPMSPQDIQELGRAGSGDLKTIARVVTAKRDYAITFDGVESLGGRTAYHLSLRPLHPSEDLRLRELWIDTHDFRTLQLITQGNFNDDSVPWLVTFRTIDGAQYIASESAEKPFSHGAYTYQNATISFDDVTPQRYVDDLWLPVTPAQNLLTEPQR
jgi:hypothetical protein